MQIAKKEVSGVKNEVLRGRGLAAPDPDGAKTEGLRYARLRLVVI